MNKVLGIVLLVIWRCWDVMDRVGDLYSEARRDIWLDNISLIRCLLRPRCGCWLRKGKRRSEFEIWSLNT